VPRAPSLGIAWIAVLVAFCGSCRSAPERADTPTPGAASDLAPPATRPLEDEILYLVMVDRFADADERAFDGRDPTSPVAWHGGDLAGVESRLDYLGDLGVTALWLTPLARQAGPVPHEGAGLHHPFHGYWPSGEPGVDPRFGTTAALRSLLDRAHARGVNVWLDVVINHRGYGAEQPGVTRDCEETADPIEQCIFGLPDLRTEDAAVRELVVDATRAWVDELPLDGFRFDAARHVEPQTLAAVRRALDGASDRPLVVAGEWWGATPEDAPALLAGSELDTLFDFTFSGLVEGFLTGRLRAEALAHHLTRWHEARRPLIFSLNTHDEPTLLHRLGDARARYPLAAALLLSTWGVPLVAWGDELGRGGGAWPHNRASMPWGKLHTDEGRALHATWRSLIQLRRRAPALRGREFQVEIAHGDDDGATLVYSRGDELFVAVHRGAGAVERIVLGEDASPSLCLAHGDVKLTRDGGGAFALTLPADSFAVFSRAACP
jgi:alpha-amylase